VSSGLHWSTTFDSASEVNFPCNFCLLELQEHQRFFSAVLDSILKEDEYIYNTLAEKVVRL